MFVLAIALCAVLAAFLIGQAVLVVDVYRRVAGKPPAPMSDADCPKALVVLCLRGGDPFLPRCIEALLRQDYPRFDVKIMVDSRRDPAWRIAEECVAKLGAQNVEMAELTVVRETCSLKCSSLHQALSNLDASYEVVALLDADVVPHATWLRELAAPFADPQIGATTGNRWYMPVETNVGSLTRYLWNAAASVQMIAYGICWGGTLAVRGSALRETELLDRWGNGFCEDTMTYSVLKKHKLKVKFVGSLMMINRETSTLSGFYYWVQRQLLCARLYHPAWSLVVGHGVGTALALGGALVALIVALANGDGLAAQWLGMGLAGYFVGLWVCIYALESAVRTAARRRGEDVNWLSPTGVVKIGLQVPFTQTVYTGALAQSTTIRKVDWRGVSYTIDGPWGVRLVEYRPYAVDPAFDATHSL
ncbi:MAG TPA: glycosyltransferase family 2 protein [Pirellulales bacterium]